MNIELIREYCLSKPRVTESFPFNDTALVFKVYGKMFALLDLSEDSRGITLKCDPELALELREQYPEVTPAYHFNKRHWNTIIIDNPVARNLICKWIDDSYQLVVDGLTRKQRTKQEEEGQEQY
ncbi:MAG: MmcQ/YjbR family DNA-binding protein [Bacteroidales bacterium]|nr:MmcQ/YjbR family DNA-binding protein [Bacteroidales bacterium]